MRPVLCVLFLFAALMAGIPQACAQQGLPQHSPNSFLAGGFPVSRLAAATREMSPEAALDAAARDIGSTTYQPALLQSFQDDLQGAANSGDACRLYDAYRAKLDPEFYDLSRYAARRFGQGFTDDMEVSFRIQPGPAGVNRPDYWPVFADLGRVLGPFSPAWSKFQPQDLGMIRMVGRVWLDALEFHEATGAMPLLCSDPGYDWATIRAPVESEDFTDALALGLAGPDWQALATPPNDTPLANPIDRSLNDGQLADWARMHDDICPNKQCLASDATLKAFFANPKAFDAFIASGTYNAPYTPYDPLLRDLARLFPAMTRVQVFGAALGAGDRTPAAIPETIRNIRIARSPALWISFEGMKGDGIDIRTSVIDRLTATDMAIEGIVLVQDSLVSAPSLTFSASHLGRLSLQGLSPWNLMPEPGSSDPPPNGFTIYASEMVIENELIVDGISGAAEIILDKSEAGVFRIFNTYAGRVSLWLGRARNLFLQNAPGINELFLAGSAIDSIAINGSPGEPARIGTIQAASLTADTNVQLADLESNSIILTGLKTPDLSLTCVSVSNTLTLLGSNVPDWASLNSVSAQMIDLTAAQMSHLEFASKRKAQPEAAPTAPPANPAAATPAPACAHDGSVEDLILTSARVDTLWLAGRIGHALWANEMQARDVSFHGDRGELGSGAFVNLRHADITSFALPADLLRPKTATVAGTTVDIEGANIGSIRLYESARDGNPFGDTDAETRRNLEGRRDRPFGREDYRELFFEQLLPSMGLTPDKQAETPYVGDVYKTLRASALAAGYPDLEKQIAIQQNDHYAHAADNPLVEGTYALGKAINRYGYDNSRGLVWLFALWLAGLLILNLDWLVVRPIRRLIRRGTAATGNPVGPPSLLHSIFFSMDRTIPSLGLDNEFSSPSAGPGMTPAQPGRMHGVKLYLIYVQRIIAFVVILFMLGGIFDVFQ